MTELLSLLKAAAKFHSLGRDMDQIGPAIIEKACEMVCAEAKRVLGTYDYGWVQLSPATLASKMADTPLLETGELRDSIEWHSEKLEGWVGSNSEKAVWQELGTANAAHPIPPRSFLVGAAQEMEGRIHTMAAKAVVSVLRGGGLHGPDMMELLHVLKDAAHRLKEDLKRLVDEDDNDKDKRR
jgi:hypothetical protein